MITWSRLVGLLGARLRQDDEVAPRLALLVIAALLCAQAVLPVAAAVLFGDVIDALSGGAGVAALWPTVAVWSGLLLLTVPATALATYQMDRFAHRLQAHVSQMVMAKATTLDLQTLEEPDVQDGLFRAQQEASKRIPSLLSALMSVVAALIAGTALLITLVAIVPVVAALLVLPVLLAFVAAAGWHRVSDWHLVRAQVMRQLRYLQRLLTEPRAAGELQAFGLGGVFLVRAAECWQELQACQTRIARWMCRADLLINGGVMVGLAAGAVYLVSQAVDAALSVGTVVMVVQLQQRTHATLHTLQRGFGLLATHGTDFQELRRFLTLESRLPVRQAPVAGPHALHEAIQFENVSFQYASAVAPAIRGLTLTLRAGSTTAIVGPNGSGKSTLLKLLCRLYDPSDGRLLWDGTDLRDFDVATLRTRIAVAFQDAQRYELDVRDNIALGSPSPLSEAGIVAAARAAGAHDMIMRLPDQYATRLGFLRRGGVELSGGQWQALTLARTMTRDAPLVLLDEPNQNLDPEAEAELFDRLRTLMAGRTAVIVSHRFSAARHADEIIVMDHGTIAERGTHAALMAQGGLYAHLFTQQARGYQ